MNLIQDLLYILLTASYSRKEIKMKRSKQGLPTFLGSLFLASCLLLPASLCGQWLETTIPAGASPGSVVYSSTNRTIYVANHGATQNVTVINAVTNSVLTTIPMGTWVGSLCYNPINNCVYVGCGADALSYAVMVINCNTNTVTNVITGVYAPSSPTHNPKNNKLYLTDIFNDRITVIDCYSNTVIKIIPLPDSLYAYGPTGLCYNETYNKIYCSSNEYYPNGVIHIINCENDSVIKTFRVGTLPSRSMVYNSTNNKVYCPDLAAPMSNITVIDGATDSVIKTIPVSRGAYYGLAYNPRENKVYCANQWRDTVYVLNGATDSIIKRIKVEHDPDALFYNPINNKVYCASCGASTPYGTTVSIISGATDSILTIIGVGSGPKAFGYYPEYNRVYVANYYGNTVSVLRDIHIFGFWVYPTNIPFMGVALGYSKTDGVTVTNTDTLGATLNIYSVVSDNPEFSVLPTSGSLAPDSSMTFYITFTPIDTGAEYGNIVFTHNAATSPDTVTVSGIGGIFLVGTKYIDNSVPPTRDTFPSFTTAICSLNKYDVGPGGLTFNVVAGQTFNERPPAITATGPSPTIFQKYGLVGVNPMITPTGTDIGTIATASFGANGDAIIKIVGSDNITFDGIDLLNTNEGTQSDRTEYGFFLVKVDGTNACKNITITNCNITLRKTTSYSSGIYVSNLNAAGSAVTVTSTGGRSEKIKIFSNTISNVFHGIQLRGYNHTAAPYDFYDQIIEVGAEGGNTISNFGGAAATYGVYAICANNLKINNNTITDATGVTSTLRGITTATGLNSNVDINYNKISLTSSATTSAFYAIENAMGGSGTNNTMNIIGNDIYNCSYTTATTGDFAGIYNKASPGRPWIVNIIGDTLRGTAHTGTGDFTGIYIGGTSYDPVYLLVKNNSIYNNKKTGASGKMYLVRGGGTSGAVAKIRLLNNNFYNDSFVTTSGTAAACIYGYYCNQWPSVESLGYNNIYNLSLSGANTGTANVLAGIYSRTGTDAPDDWFFNNNIYGFSSTLSCTIYGIYKYRGTNGFVYNNNIYDLSFGGATGIVHGLVTGGVSTAVWNNFISDLKAPASTMADAINGINIRGGTNIGVYYNTIYLDATSSSAIFGTSGIYTHTIPTVDLRNNVVVNVSTPGSTSGFTAAYRRMDATLTTYASTSNNNCFYAGTPSTNRLIYYDGTNAIQTLSEYQSWVTPRDEWSVTENPPFINVSTTPYNLHINSAIATSLESGGTPIPGITTDFDGDTRHPTYPDIGADEFTTTYTIIATASAGGSITPFGAVIVNEGEDTTFTITPDLGHHLDSLVVDGENHGPDSTSYTFEAVTDDHTIDAYFSISTYTITASATSGGSITPSGDVFVTYGEDTTFTIIADLDGQLDSLIVDGISHGPDSTSYTFEDVDADHTIHAMFSLTALPGWAQRESIITPQVNKIIKDGGALVGVPGSDKDASKLFAFLGTKTNRFRKYTVGLGWSDAETLLFGHKYNTSTHIVDSIKFAKKFPGKGAALCFDGENTIYATKGNGTWEFFAYDMLSDAGWTAKAFVPSLKGLKGGTSIRWFNGKVYLLAGGQKKDPTVDNFFVYTPEGDSDLGTPWTALGKLPLGPDTKNWKDGSSIVELGGTIYAIHGGAKTNLFYAYNWGTNTWLDKEPLPIEDSSYHKYKKKLIVKDGAASASGDGVIYATKGGGTEVFWKYTPTTDVGWERLDRIPIEKIDKKHAPKTGAAMAYVDGKVWLLVGNKQVDFWCYVPTAAKSEKRIANSVNNVIASSTQSNAAISNFSITPNPFTKLTTIRYTVPISDKVSIKLYNSSGRLVETFANEYHSVGSYKLNIDNCKLKIPYGVYFLKYEDQANKSEIKLIVQ